MSEKTYTFIWQAHGENPAGFWVQKASYMAKTVDEAWSQLLRDVEKRDWQPKLNDSILIIYGEHHFSEYGRAVFERPPLVLQRDASQKEVQL